MGVGKQKKYWRMLTTVAPWGREGGRNRQGSSHVIRFFKASGSSHREQRDEMVLQSCPVMLEAVPREGHEPGQGRSLSFLERDSAVSPQVAAPL